VVPSRGKTREIFRFDRKKEGGWFLERGRGGVKKRITEAKTEGKKRKNNKLFGKGGAVEGRTMN